MADSKLADLTATTSLDGDELFYVVDDPAGTPLDRKITATNVLATAVKTTGAETIAGVKTFSSDPVIPDEVYGVGWNGSLEPPTKNAVYDKIETIGGGGSVATDTIFDAKGDLPVGTAADTAARLAVGTNGHVLTADSAETTGLKWAAAGGGLTFVGVRGGRATTKQTVTSGTWTELTFNTEDYDTDAFHSTVSDTGAFTVPTGLGGWYLITASAEYPTHATGSRHIRVRLNRTTVIGYGMVAVNSSAWGTVVKTTDVYQLAAGDVVTLDGFQDSGTSMSVPLNLGDARHHLALVRLTT